MSGTAEDGVTDSEAWVVQDFLNTDVDSYLERPSDNDQPRDTPQDSARYSMFRHNALPESVRVAYS